MTITTRSPAPFSSPAALPWRPRHGPRHGRHAAACGQHHPAARRDARRNGPLAVACTAALHAGTQFEDAQNDKIFKIMHDQAPALRDKAKEVRANYELHGLMFLG